MRSRGIISEFVVAIVSLALTAAGCASKQAEPAVAPGVSTASVAPDATASTTPSSSAAPGVPVAQPAILSYQGIVDAPDRSPEDRALDPGRHPVELLKFLGVQPGMKVAEISAGGGYTTELLARAVGPNGVVYGQNSKLILEKYAEQPWSERLKKPIMKNVVRVDREFDSPLPVEATNLDLVIDNLFYHDTVWMKTDRNEMNQAIFAALRRGGVYVVIDHSGRPGTGTTEAQTLHRIDEQVVRSEVEKAGFHLLADSNFLRNPKDTLDWSASPRTAGEKRGTSDRFALKFVRP